MPADPFGIASSFFKIHQSWMFNGLELFNITSKLSASIQAVAAEQLTSSLPESQSAKGQAG